MSIKKIIIGAIVFSIVALIYISLGGEENTGVYIQSVEKERIDKNESLSTSTDSPFKVYGDTTVILKYFPVDPKYKVTAQIDLIDSRQYMTLGSSTGESVKYLKYAYAHFRMEGKGFKLLILKDMESKKGQLFTAFADETSAEQTYGGGRYLDLDFKRAKRITIDFNKAYNPYCNYNDSYSCPLPPRENLLAVRIEAGEKDYKKTY